MCEPRLVVELPGPGSRDLDIDAREAGARPALDLHHLRPEIAERFRRDRSHQRPREIEHANAGERSRAAAGSSVRRFALGPRNDAHEPPRDAHAVALAPEPSRGKMRVREHIGRLVERRRIDAAAPSLARDVRLRPRAEECADRLLPVRAHSRIECGAVVAQPVRAAERIAQSRRVDPVAERLVRRRAEAAGHQRVKAPAIGERPDAADRGAAVVERAAYAVQLAAVELPDQDAVYVAAEGDLLDRDIDVLSAAARAPLVVRGHRAGRGDHVGMETAGVQRFLDRRTVRRAGQSEHTTHRRGDEFRSGPSRARPDAAEERDRDMSQRGIGGLDTRAGPAQGFERREPNSIDEKRGIGELAREPARLDGSDSRAERAQEARERAFLALVERQNEMPGERIHALPPEAGFGARPETNSLTASSAPSAASQRRRASTRWGTRLASSVCRIAGTSQTEASSSSISQSTTPSARPRTVRSQRAEGRSKKARGP